MWLLPGVDCKFLKRKRLFHSSVCEWGFAVLGINVVVADENVSISAETCNSQFNHPPAADAAAVVNHHELKAAQFCAFMIIIIFKNMFWKTFSRRKRRARAKHKMFPVMNVVWQAAGGIY